MYEWTEYESNGDDFQPLKKVKAKGENSRWFPEPYNYLETNTHSVTAIQVRYVLGTKDA